MYEVMFYILALFVCFGILILGAALSLYIFSPSVRQCIKDDWNNGGI